MRAENDRIYESTGEDGIHVGISEVIAAGTVH